MAIKSYDKKEDVPEAQRAGAIETADHKWIVEEVDPALGEAGEATLKKLRAEKLAEKKRADEAEQKLEEARIAAQAAEGKVGDAALAKLREEFDKKLLPLQEKNKELTNQIRERDRERLIDALALSKDVRMIPERLAKAKKDLVGRLDLNEAGDDLVVRDAKGNITTETAKDFLAKTYKAEASWFYQGTGASGGGGEENADGGGAGGYDAVKAGKDAAAEQKKGKDQNALAFK